MQGNNNGSALLLALMIAVLAGSITVLLITQRQADIARSSIIFTGDAAALAVSRIIIEAKINLIQSWVAAQKNHTPEKLPIYFPTTTIEGGTISGYIEDLQAKFNINNLLGAPIGWSFINLLQMINPEMSAIQATNINNAVSNWVNPANSTLDGIYLQRQMPYRVAHQPLQSSGELPLIDGITPRIAQRLLSHISELPPPTALNINSADAVALLALNNHLTLAQTQEIVAYRKQQSGFKTLDEFTSLPFFSGETDLENRITLFSDYFLVHGFIQLNGQQRVFYTLLQREIINQHVQVRIVWQYSLR